MNNINQIKSNRVGSGRKILPNRKLSPDYISNKTNKEKENKNSDNKKDRMVEMYEKGTADIKKRKNRRREKA